MTSVVERPVLASAGAGRWRYDLDALAVAGVELTDDQHDLLVSPDAELIVAAFPLPAPEQLYHGADMSTAAPLEVTNAPGGPLRRATAPFLAEVRWDAAPVLDERVGPFWRRFPSLPVRVVYAETNFWPIDWVNDIRFVRIWDTVACDSQLASEMMYFAYALGGSWNAYTKLGLFWASIFNLIEDCELAEQFDGIKPEFHRHHQVPWTDLLFDIKCVDGEEVFNRLEHELFISGHRGSPVKEFPLPEMDSQLSTVWHELAARAPAVARQAMQVAPSKAAALLDDERKGGCPWE